MEISTQTLLLLPAGLGLLGFIEPCTIGGHLLFLDTQKDRSKAGKIRAVTIFVMVRALMAGLFGAAIAFLGHKLINLQTLIWLLFGVLYMIIGLAFVFRRARLVKQQVNLAPARWKTAKNPLVLAIAFGLNIPACAAPILFGLLGLAATSGTTSAGFAMMFVFGFFLSAPLAVFAVVPGLANRLDRFGHWLKNVRWLIGLVFIGLGLWSIWFGLYVDPQNWSGK